MSAEKLYDLSMVREISRGNDEFVLKMVQLFINTMQAEMEELKKYLSEKNWVAIGGIAHKIKSSIDTMGIILLKEDIRKLETYGKEQLNLDEVPILIQKIITVLSKVIQALKVEYSL